MAVMWHSYLCLPLLVLEQTLLIDHDVRPCRACAPGSHNQSTCGTGMRVGSSVRSWPRGISGISSPFWLRECSAVATALGETKSLNRSWQWHLKKEKTGKKNCFSNIWFPNIFICNSKSTDHMHYICSGLGFKQGL